jgi:RNA-binding protein NOB1
MEFCAHPFVFVGIMAAKIVVVDSCGFFKNISLLSSLADRYCTTHDVMKEIKDQSTRDMIASLPIQLEIRNVSPESLKYGK